MLALSLLSCAAAPASVADRQPLYGCSVIDGDTIRCQDERIRLLGIDAPELAGHCRTGRQCVAGDPLRSKLALEQAVAGKRLTIERVGKGRYGRTLGVIYADGRNVSCFLIEGDYAVYVGKWDNGDRVRLDCPAMAR
jgi:endonuclease YncB( thermonuclease family)